ncbi:MAG TPA: hypothetical protein VGD29_01345 [Actinoplanes sp.]
MGWVLAAAVGAAAGWGISDFLAGVLTRRLPVLTILIGSDLAAMVLALLVVAVRGVAPVWDARVWPAVVAGLVGLPAMGLLYRAMRDGSPAVVAPVAAARVTEGVFALILALIFRPGIRVGLSVVAVGVSDVLADAGFIASAAEALTPAAVVASLYPAVTLLLNRSFLRERLHTVHLYGVIAAVLSVACLAR